MNEALLKFILLFVRISYSMRDLLSDPNNYANKRYA